MERERYRYNLPSNCKRIAEQWIYGNVMYDYAEEIGYEYLYKCDDGRYILQCFSTHPYAAMDDDYPYTYSLTRDEARDWVDDGAGATEISNDELIDLFPELKGKLKLGVEAE